MLMQKTSDESAVETGNVASIEVAASRAHGFIAASLAVAACTCVNWLLRSWLEPTDLAMVYLLGIVLVSYRVERLAAVLCALGSVIAFDFFFAPPIFTLRFGHTEYVITAAALLVVGLVISTLATRAREQMRSASIAASAAREERLRNSLLASLSHDLRTPLAVIAGSASNLIENRQRLSDAEQQLLLETLYDESRHVSLLVSDLLEMTRLDGGVALDRQWYPLEELVGAALQRCAAQLSQHEIRTLLADSLPLVRVDGILIEKLLVNLLENAAKYTPSATTITIAAIVEGERLRIQIDDEGPGIPADAEEKIFEKFVRLAPEGSMSGSGLGLSICRAIADLHGARIGVNNRPGGGASFAFVLPLERQPEAEPTS
jgi:two-component system, OmpR family, sensor histidine kinase KdpD